jgi:hypothetical protein
MPDLSNYTGKPPSDLAMAFIRALEGEGFKIAATAQGPKEDQRKTLRITWRGIYVGLMSEGLWGRKVPYLCLYRFPKDGRRVSVAKAPAGFDVDIFARQHQCDARRLHVNSDYSGSYLWIQDEATGLKLLRLWARRVDELFFPSRGTSEPAQIQEDLRSILDDITKPETERLAEVAARLGQGKFRAALERDFGDACAATRVDIAPVLRASHIVPWRHATAAQRLDPMNGLLLSANLDALFDRYMITFLSDGKVAISKSLMSTDLDGLGPLPDLRCAPSEKRAEYLKRHNAEFARLEQQRAELAKASNQ